MKRAFTIIELLVVIAIIAVLIGIGFGVMGPSREKSRQTVCVSNLHQIGQAVAMYIADYDGIEPVKEVRMTPYELGLPCAEHSTDALFQNYLKNSQVRHCPSERTESGGYRWPLFLNPSTLPDLDLSGIVAQRGPDYVLVACDQHNASLDFSKQPRWLNKTVIVLRISQQIETKQIPVNQVSGFTW